MDLLSLGLWLLLLLLVFCVIWWAAHRLAGAFGLSGTIMAVVEVLLVIVFLFMLVGGFLGGVRVPAFR
jgi:hypothetical protein